MAEMYVQEMMSPNIVPLAKGPKTYNSFADWLLDPEADVNGKRKWIWQVKDFITLNAITKKDLHAALKFMAEDCYHVESKPRLAIVKDGDSDG